MTIDELILPIFIGVILFHLFKKRYIMSKIFALACIIGSVFNPTQTKVLLAKAVDIVHGLSGVITHYVNIAQ